MPARRDRIDGSSGCARLNSSSHYPSATRISPKYGMPHTARSRLCHRATFLLLGHTPDALSSTSTAVAVEYVAGAATRYVARPFRGAQRADTRVGSHGVWRCGSKSTIPTEGGEALLIVANDQGQEQTGGVLAAARAVAADASWYAIWTKSNCERLVAQQLAAKGFAPFLPEIG